MMRCDKKAGLARHALTRVHPGFTFEMEHSAAGAR